MLKIDCTDRHFSEIGELIRHTQEKSIEIDNAQGHRYIASGVGGKDIVIYGTPGNALGRILTAVKLPYTATRRTRWEILWTKD